MPASKRFTPALAFHALTPLYDALVDLLGFGRTFVDRVATALHPAPGEVLLDVGCGTGSLLAVLASRFPGARGIGIDADQRMLSRAAQKLGPGRLAQAFAQALPFPDATFDAAASTLIFHHLPTEVKRAAIAEIHRVLRVRGRFLLADFGKPQTITQRTLLHLGSLFDGVGNMRANIGGRLPQLLAEGGFQVTEVAPRYRAVQFLLARK